MQTQELRTKYLMILVVHMYNRVMYIFWISGRLDAIHHIVSFHRAVIVARLYYGDFSSMLELHFSHLAGTFVESDLH